MNLKTLDIIKHTCLIASASFATYASAELVHQDNSQTVVKESTIQTPQTTIKENTQGDKDIQSDKKPTKIRGAHYCPPCGRG